MTIRKRCTRCGAAFCAGLANYSAQFGELANQKRSSLACDERALSGSVLPFSESLVVKLLNGHRVRFSGHLPCSCALQAL